MKLASARKLTSQEEKWLNQLNKQITNILIIEEQNIKGHHNSYSWSPELHGTVRLVSIWKSNLTQYRIKSPITAKYNFSSNSCRHQSIPDGNARQKKECSIGNYRVKMIRKRRKNWERCTSPKELRQWTLRTNHHQKIKG